MNDEQSRRKAWKRALANTKLEYPDWQPDKEYMELIEKNMKNEMSTEEIIEILIKKYKRKSE